jgi:hypothetical protein
MRTAAILLALLAIPAGLSTGAAAADCPTLTIQGPSPVTFKGAGSDRVTGEYSAGAVVVPVDETSSPDAVTAEYTVERRTYRSMVNGQCEETYLWQKVKGDYTVVLAGELGSLTTAGGGKYHCTFEHITATDNARNPPATVTLVRSDGHGHYGPLKAPTSSTACTIAFSNALVPTYASTVFAGRPEPLSAIPSMPAREAEDGSRWAAPVYSRFSFQGDFRGAGANLQLIDQDIVLPEVS